MIFFLSIIPELSHMFGQALAQWRAFSLAVARSSRLHSFSRSGHLSRCCMVCSEVPHSQAVYLLHQHSPIYSSWFCCGPYPCGVCWGTSTASTQIYGQVLVVHWLGLAALQFVVPPTMLALLFEEAVTVAGLHEGSSSSCISDENQ